MLLSLCLAGCQDNSAPAAQNGQQAAGSGQQAAGSGQQAEKIVRPLEPNGNGSSRDGQQAEVAPAAAAADKPVELVLADSSAARAAQAKQGQNETLSRSFDDLKFDIEKGAPFDRSMLTEKIEDLVGKRIRIRGYILPSFQQTGLTQFVLVRDNMECCFGPGAALYDCILVDMAEGKSTNFSIRPVAVEGVFSINELIGPDGKHLAIFHLRADSVK